MIVQDVVRFVAFDVPRGMGPSRLPSMGSENAVRRTKKSVLENRLASEGYPCQDTLSDQFLGISIISSRT